jgi:hypothetical protein
LLDFSVFPWEPASENAISSQLIWKKRPNEKKPNADHRMATKKMNSSGAFAKKTGVK